MVDEKDELEEASDVTPTEIKDWEQIIISALVPSAQVVTDPSNLDLRKTHKKSENVRTFWLMIKTNLEKHLIQQFSLNCFWEERMAVLASSVCISSSILLK